MMIKRELSCKGYLRYVDDFALFSNSKAQLWEWKVAIKKKLASLRLIFHQGSAQVTPVTQGIPWLGFIIHPTHKRIKKRKVIYAKRHLRHQYAAYKKDEISLTEFDAMIQGWINHVRYADSWGLRKHVLKDFLL